MAGWGVPIVLVGISLGISFDHIPSKNFCWLSTEGGAIYAFVAPALAVIVINIVLLGIVLREIRRIIDRDITKIDVSKAKTTAKVLLVFTPVMGAPWVFGILAINEDTVIFDYLFTALNSFQGLMIFLIHTVGNKEFRSKVYRGKRTVDPFSSSRGRSNLSSSGVTTTTVVPIKREVLI
ncbi:adhesion G-protein coupled receptor D1-like [Strongylocentrotus purpuratus]|uniref:G-protein coupled receptors family 2 profile 2 domain-containing protein n=1 Tax=Strongylocentrotus purpuratus TaxID=7668 RepID=A0A7M7P184_STRPU|nr:adhesion G-protein coupled receptor D1-like [Strongylocentrotus purpuratus]